MRLTRDRLRSLKATHGYALISSLPRLVLLWLARTDVEIEKLKYTPSWFARRRELVRRRNGWRPQPPRPIPAVPSQYKTAKRSHWLKDHHRRIDEILATAVCMEATGPWPERPDQMSRYIEMFNAHIAPIAELYGFKLQMELSAGRIDLRGDISRASCVLLYLTSNSRTPETDWLLDIVTLVQLAKGPIASDWQQASKRAWNKKLRHTKCGQHWRARRDAREKYKPGRPGILETT